MASDDDDKGNLATKRRNEEKSLSQLYCYGDLTYVKDIASGGMSKVSLYILDKDGSQARVAVKTLFRKIIPERDLKHLRTEVNILTNVDHENIIRTYGIAEIECDFGLVLEYFPNGCYTDFFSEFWKGVSQKTEVVKENISPLKLRIIKEIINAMEYLHLPRKLPLSAKEKSTLHLDLKGENVLLDDQLHVKICDFGLSMMATLTRLRTGTTIHRGASGTPGFIAPERLKNFNCKPNTKCDVYSFGILQYTILTDIPPYPDHVVQDLKLLEHYVAEKELRPDVSKVSKIFPLDLIHLMKRCWSAEPDCRPSFEELNGRLNALLGQINDFERQSTHAADRVISIISERNRPVHHYDAPNIERLPDLVSFATNNTGTVTPSDSVKTPQASNQIKSPVAETSEVGSHLHSASQERLDHVRSVGSRHVMSQSSGLSSQRHLSTTREKTPISCDAREDEPSDMDSRSSNYNSPRRPSNHDDNDDTDDGDADDDTQLLSPCQREIGVVEIEGPFCSLTKMLLSVAVCVIFAAAVTIAVVIPLVHNSGSTDGRTCPPIHKPKHGTVKCENETMDTAAKCRFTCDDNFEIDGSDTIVCNAGRWSTKEPTCELACEVPKIPNGIVKCTNHTFIHSTCSISCENHHVIEGKSIITCRGNGSWSAPVPSCVCPKCSVGDNCEYSISWQSVVNNLATMQPYGTIPVNYGGKLFVCSTEVHSIRIYWEGKCVDKGTGTMSKCSTDHSSPSGAADAAAANLIHRLMDRKIFPEPCDANKMPTSC